MIMIGVSANTVNAACQETMAIVAAAISGPTAIIERAALWPMTRAATASG